ncbi:MAG TPA: hypothetical protein VJW23_19540 [Propionibacteriaceae bacterium]|nr:hypothetical protein [Propionibacteriaceae bacterium]
MPKKQAEKLKPIKLTLDPDPSMSAKQWEILRRRVYVAVAKTIAGSGLEVKPGDDP